MPAYNSSDFHPPAPVVVVQVLSEIAPGIQVEAPLLIDSGADVTMLPRERIGAFLSTALDPKFYEVESFDGSRSHVQVIACELRFLGKSFRGQFLIVDGQYGILGRNILNNLVITLDGPRKNWEELRG